MKHVDEYRDAGAAQALARRLKSVTTQPWTIMEICGGQTHAIARYGLEDLLPREITLVHGPGCPVCVTPLETLDRAMAIAALPGVIFTSFGDMLRVPGSTTDLLAVRAEGGDVRMVYSPLDALRLAEENPDREVVFFAVGFETTAPANVMAVKTAAARGIRNFSILSSHVLVPPAIDAILSSPDNRVQAFLAAGHVCTVMGLGEYHPLAARHGAPIVVTGFEPVDILRGLLRAVELLEAREARVDNAYARSVREEGNPAARALLADMCDVYDAAWRGIGTIPRSGYRLREAFASFDAALRFSVDTVTAAESPLCIAGDILRGNRLPAQCSAFATHCTPEHPLGAPMVSSEGVCAAYYRFRRGSAQE